MPCNNKDYSRLLATIFHYSRILSLTVSLTVAAAGFGTARLPIEAIDRPFANPGSTAKTLNDYSGSALPVRLLTRPSTFVRPSYLMRSILFHPMRPRPSKPFHAPQ